jgi:hypothetical protein
MKETFGFERALALLKEGKKVRLNNWSSDGHMYLVNNRLCHVYEQLPTKTDLLNVNLIMATNWELYEEPKPTLRPWRLEEVPVGALTKLKDEDNETLMIVGVRALGALLAQDNGAYPLGTLLALRVHSTDGGKTWHPCGVLE